MKATPTLQPVTMLSRVAGGGRVTPLPDISFAKSINPDENDGLPEDSGGSASHDDPPPAPLEELECGACGPPDMDTPVCTGDDSVAGTGVGIPDLSKEEGVEISTRLLKDRLRARSLRHLMTHQPPCKTCEGCMAKARQKRDAK